MSLPNSVGESSSKRQENGDASSSSERPLKKARFAWQVKGKYHLKNETNDTSLTSADLSNDSDRAGTSSENKDSSNSFVGNTEQNLEILGDYLLKQDFNTLDSVITDTDKSLLTPSTRINTGTIHYPRYVSSYDNNRPSTNFTRSSPCINELTPMSTIVPNNYCEDQCIARWQARQMAKGFVDNTINRVLDSWTHRPLPPAVDHSTFLALDVADFINNLPGDNSIENEGILMAISAHGLQNTSNSSSNDVSHNDEEQTYNTLSNKDEAFLSPPSSPVHSDEEILNIESNNNKDSERVSSSHLTWISSEDNIKKDNDITPFSLFPDTSNSYQYFSENGHLHRGSIECDSVENHYDFMDAAVSFAIQNKGLTTFGTDYG